MSSLNSFLATYWNSFLTIINFTILLILYFLRNTVSKYITKSIDSAFEHKLEKIKSEFRQLETKQQFIQKCLSNVLINDGFIQKQRLTALQNLWTSFIKIKGYSQGLSQFAAIDIQTWNQLSKEDKKITLPLFGEMQTLGKRLKEMTDEELSRIWVPETVWLYFYSYKKILSYFLTQLLLLHIEGSVENVKTDKLIEILKIFNEETTEPPSLQNNSLYSLLEKLENKLFKEITIAIDGHEQNAIELEKVQKIIRSLDEMHLELPLGKLENASA